MPIEIDHDLCDKCKKCIKICQYKTVILDSNIDRIKILSNCTECLACIEICKNKAIKNVIKKKKIPNFSIWNNVYVFIEINESLKKIREISLEVLSKGRKLADELNEKLVAILVGFKLKECSKFLENFGVDLFIIADNVSLKNYDSEIYSEVVNKIITNKKPRILLFGSTYLGRDLAPRVAKIAKTGLTADCTSLKIDQENNTLIQTRPAFGGNLFADIVTCYSRPQMATIRSGVEKSNINKRKFSKIEFVKCEGMFSRTKIIKKVLNYKSITNLNEAKIVVSGGRGMKNIDGFKLIYKLAETIGCEVGGTRIAAEKGWINEKNQIGQTGQTVRPNLYIACGISGAIQHRAGILNSKFIIAINNDPYAPIFKISNWGIVGNVFKILPELIKQF